MWTTSSSPIDRPSAMRIGRNAAQPFPYPPDGKMPRVAARLAKDLGRRRRPDDRTIPSGRPVAWLAGVLLLLVMAGGWWRSGGCITTRSRPLVAVADGLPAPGVSSRSPCGGPRR